MRFEPGPCVGCSVWGATDCGCMTDEQAISRVAELEKALSGVLLVIDTRGFMTPEQQDVLARAREVLGK